MNPSKRKKIYRAELSGGTEATLAEAPVQFKAEVLPVAEPVKEVINPQITDAVTQIAEPVPVETPAPVKKGKKTTETVTDPAV